MKKLETRQMEEINGGAWSKNSFICGAAVVYSEYVIGATLVLAGVSGETSLLVGATIGLAGAVACASA